MHRRGFNFPNHHGFILNTCQFERKGHVADDAHGQWVGFLEDHGRVFGAAADGQNNARTDPGLGFGQAHMSKVLKFSGTQGNGRLGRMVGESVSSDIWVLRTI